MGVSEDISVLPQLESLMIERDEPYDAIIIGGGPAGLTAGIYCARSGMRTLLVERALLGGQVSLCSMIDNYPGFPSGVAGMELANRFEEQARRFGVEIVWGEAQKIEVHGSFKKVYLTDLVFTGRTVIISTGSEPKKLGIPGEEEFRGRGVSYCATCDGAFYKDKEIVVIGGGNSAISEAIFLTRFASKVSIVHRRSLLRADKILADHAMAEPRIEFVWESTVQRIIGKDTVEAVEVRDVKTNKIRKIETDGIFIYIGESPNIAIVKEMVDLSEDGSILAGHNMATSQEGIFAAGDVCKKTLRQIATAVGDGAMAADTARKYLENML